MARRKSKKSSKCPEPLNTLIDIAGGLAMGAVANRMEKKYHYSEKGKINPYAVSAAGIASGRMKSTKDILRTGAVLGAMGSFDVDADDERVGRSFVPEDPVFNEIRGAKVNDNRYAWRLNCEDGTEYGIVPQQYETKAEFNAALTRAKGTNQSLGAKTPAKEKTISLTPKESQGEKHIFCRVSSLETGINQYYLTSNHNLKAGDLVNIPGKYGSAQGVVLSICEYTKNTAPVSVEETPWLKDK